MNEAAPTLTEIGSTGAPADASAFHAWNPGLEPGLPRAMRPFATLFRPENVALSYPEILELSDLSGLPANQIAPFRPERLAVHEVLIRVMADISVPVGEVYADLGLNFRRIVTTLLREGVAQRLDAVAATYEAVRAEADAILDRELAALLDEPPAPVPEPASGWGRWLARLGAPPPPLLGVPHRPAMAKPLSSPASTRAAPPPTKPTPWRAPSARRSARCSTTSSLVREC